MELMRAMPLYVPADDVTSTSWPVKYGGTHFSPFSFAPAVPTDATVRVPNDGNSVTLPVIVPSSTVTVPNGAPGPFTNIVPPPAFRSASVPGEPVTFIFVSHEPPDCGSLYVTEMAPPPPPLLVFAPRASMRPSPVSFS